MDARLYFEVLSRVTRRALPGIACDVTAIATCARDFRIPRDKGRLLLLFCMKNGAHK